MENDEADCLALSLGQGDSVGQYQDKPDGDEQIDHRLDHATPRNQK